VTTSQDSITRADLDLAVERLEARIDLSGSHLETRMAELDKRIAEALHAQTRQMFQMLIPVYGGIIISLLVFLISKLL
jgi:hypothetical protein